MESRKIAIPLLLLFLVASVAVFYLFKKLSPLYDTDTFLSEIKLKFDISAKSTPRIKSTKLSNDKTLVTGAKIAIVFKSTPNTYTLTKCPLMYNKDFAFSFTLDDGKACAFDYAFPLVHGGRNDILNKDFTGLYFSDGCGNNIPFKLGIAMCSINPNGIDYHIKKNPNNITWDELKTMYENDWDVLNHSLSHQTGPGTNYEYEIEQNLKHVYEKTGITMTHFVIPGGDTGYLKPAIRLGMKSIYNQRFFKGINGVLTDTIQNLEHYQMYRQVVEDNNLNQFIEKLDDIAAQSSPDDHLWYSAFTHHVCEKPQGGSIEYPTFENYMTSLENKYGIKGKDNMYMATLQEVYEYLQTRNGVEVSSRLYGDTLLLYLDFSGVPDQRRYQLSLSLESDEDIDTILTEENISFISFSNGKSNKLINLKWNSKPQRIYQTDPPATSLGNIGETLSNANLHTYPNPVSDKLLLTSPNIITKLSQLTLIDPNGNYISIPEYTCIDNHTIEIDLSPYNLAEALYYISFNSGDKKN